MFRLGRMATIPQAKLALGLVLLLVVNLVWVLSAEVSKASLACSPLTGFQYLFDDLKFKRPFFATYIKSCLFSLFLLRYLICGPQSTETEEGPSYSPLNLTEQSDDDFETESLTMGEFEPIPFPSDYESEDQHVSKVDDAEKKKRKVRFSLWREVRRLPEAIAQEAKLARLPYRPPPLECHCRMSPAVKYTVYFAPLWFLSSVTYQAALLFSSVSSVNMISASSSLFVLVLGACFSPHSVDRFSFVKLALVIMNIAGVAIVSQFSSVWAGTVLATFSAMTYAIYLVVFSVVTRKSGSVDMNLLFGVIGVFSLIICTPLMIVVHITGLEPQLPLPDSREFMLVLLNGLVGSVMSDYLWLYATLLTNSLISSISLTLTIPLSMFADAMFRRQFPDAAQLLAAIPIMVSFLGASLLSHNAEEQAQSTNGNNSKTQMGRRVGDVRFKSGSKSEEQERLVDDQDDASL